MLNAARHICFGLLIMCCAPSANATPPKGFAAPSELSPNIVEDIRYATSRNFTGKPVPGYGAPRCWLREEVAKALAAVADDAARLGYKLMAYDCYRPKRAVAAFVAWAKDVSEQSQKAEYYPDIAKSDLLGAYIGSRSQHSAGVAVDVGLARLDGSAVDLGTPFDFFSKQSNTANAVDPRVKHHRQTLVKLMARHGFKNYPGEWWHFSYDLKSAEAVDFPIE
jgi:zinc D-Ala-D-Ala dipeptidase